MSELHCECGRHFLDSPGVAAVAAVSLQRLYSLKSAGKVPPPAAELASGPVWAAETILEWVAERSTDPRVIDGRRRRKVDVPTATGEPIRQPIRPQGNAPVGGGEATTQTIRQQGQRWVGSCSCGWSTPPMADRHGCDRRLQNHAQTH